MVEMVRTEDLCKYFPVKKLLFTIGHVHAVDKVNIFIRKGECFGLVGESGCGKTTLGRLLLRLIEPTSGKIFFMGEDITKFDKKRMREFRKKAQIVFQDPYSSLDPRMTIFDIIYEPISAAKMEVDNPEEYVISLLEEVGLKKEHLYRYPHEFSGGQRQRIVIARALALKPEFLVLDEPTSALDVSVQAQILNMLKEFQEKYKFTYLFISHDLSVVKYMSDRMAVMYLGQIVELGPADELWENPMHPYTMMLFSALPIPDPKLTREKAAKRALPKGEVPTAFNPPPGCRFHPRCPYAKDICKKEDPKMLEVEPDHFVACHLYDKR